METTTLAPSALKHSLAAFTGSENFFRTGMGSRHVYTNGVRFLAEQAGAYWLIDLIASYQGYPHMKSEAGDFQVWYIVVFENGPSRSAIVWCECITGKIAVQQTIEYTDFPLGVSREVVNQMTPEKAGDLRRQGVPFKLFARRNELGGMTIMVPSEN